MQRSNHEEEKGLFKGEGTMKRKRFCAEGKWLSGERCGGRSRNVIKRRKVCGGAEMIMRIKEMVCGINPVYYDSMFMTDALFHLVPVYE